MSEEKQTTDMSQRGNYKSSLYVYRLVTHIYYWKLREWERFSNFPRFRFINFFYKEHFLIDNYVTMISFWCNQHTSDHKVFSLFEFNQHFGLGRSCRFAQNQWSIYFTILFKTDAKIPYIFPYCFEFAFCEVPKSMNRLRYFEYFFVFSRYFE